MLLNSSVLITEKSDGKKEVWVGEVLLLFLCLMKGENEAEVLAYMRYMECVPLLDGA